MAAGRPSKYDPKYCEEVGKLFREGCSIEEIAYEIDVHVDTIAEWQKVHPEFSAAMKKGRKFAEGRWMKDGRVNIHNKEFNTALWYINMKNRYGWTDKKEIKQEVKSEVSVEVSEANERVKKAYEKSE